MKNCPSCRRDNPDSSRFCVYCGTPLGEAAARPDYRQPQGASYGGYSAPEYSGGYMARPASTRQQAAVKNTTASKTAILTAIFFTIALVAGIMFSSLLPGILTDRLNSFLNNFDAYDIADFVEEYTGEDITDYITIRDLDGYLDYIDEALGYVKTNSGSSSLSRIFSSISSKLVPIVFAVGVWICCIAAKKGTEPGCGSTGIVMIKVVEILRLVGACFGAFLGVMIPLVLGIVLSKNSPDYAPIAWAALLLFVVICGISVLYRAYLVSAVNRIKTASAAAPGKGKIAGFVVFMLWLSGIVTILKGLGFIGLSVLIGGVAVLPLLSAVATGLGLISAGRYLSKTKKALA